MATQTLTYQPWLQPASLTKVLSAKVNGLISNIAARRSIVISVGIVLLGLAIPVFMLLELLPASLLIGFAGLGFTAIGSVFSLFYLGDF
jgi:hypothetical protein